MIHSSTRKRKLIEVALPLDEINAACKADKDRKTGTIRNLHKWFAPMPLPAWRALLFAALVDDPEDDNQRVYLLDLIKRLVATGANPPNEGDTAEAQAVLAAQFPGGLPTVMDPFCGGGSTLVEGQRLGLDTYGSDLNPVPVLISRVLTELLPRSYDQAPLHPEVAQDANQLNLDRGPLKSSGYEGLIHDLKYYSAQVSAEAWAAISPYYPAREGERNLCWLWARTVQCPNPTCGIETVLTTSWLLSKKPGEAAWVRPQVTDGAVTLEVVSGRPIAEMPTSPKIGRGAFACVGCSATLTAKYLQRKGKQGELGTRLTAVQVERAGRKLFRTADARDADAANSLAEELRGAAIPLVGKATKDVGPYGFSHWNEVYTSRQWMTLEKHAELVSTVKDRVLSDGGTEDYAALIASMLGLAVGRMSQYQSTLVRWFIDSRSGGGQPLPAFGRHDLPMAWDFAEPTPESGAGSLTGAVKSSAGGLGAVAHGTGVVRRQDAREARCENSLVATDPPYFEAISYADLSDYFYLWHRKSLRSVHRDLYATVATPKESELTALPYRHGGDSKAARDYFIEGFTQAFTNLQRSMAPSLPMLVVYASKEKSSLEEGSGRWSSILTAALASGLEITGTWPVHGTHQSRMVGIGSNAVATYIVLVCRERSEDAGTTTLTDFNRALRRELGPAVRDLQAASILPVDLAQAAMGPGMQIFSRYRAVLDQAGKHVEVGQALRMINAALAEVLDEQEGEMDPASRFAVRWWDTHAWSAAPFGEADKTARPLGIGVDDVVRAQIVTSQGNKVQLVGAGALDRRWAPDRDSLPTAWEAVHHLADRLIDGGGELEAAKLMGRLGSLQDSTMALTYRLHDIAARKGRTVDQERYNALINSWAELVRLSGNGAATMEELF